MSKPEWGMKRICPSCGKCYYDMKKKPALCPACGTAFDPDALLKARRRNAQADDPRKGTKARKSAVPTPAETEDILVDDADLAGGGDETLEEDLMDDDLDEEVAEVAVEAVDEAEEV